MEAAMPQKTGMVECRADIAARRTVAEGELVEPDRIACTIVVDCRVAGRMTSADNFADTEAAEAGSTEGTGLETMKIQGRVGVVDYTPLRERRGAEVEERKGNK